MTSAWWLVVLLAGAAAVAALDCAPNTVLTITGSTFIGIQGYDDQISSTTFVTEPGIECKWQITTTAPGKVLGISNSYISLPEPSDYVTIYDGVAMQPQYQLAAVSHYASFELLSQTQTITVLYHSSNFTKTPLSWWGFNVTVETRVPTCGAATVQLTPAVNVPGVLQEPPATFPPGGGYSYHGGQRCATQLTSAGAVGFSLSFSQVYLQSGDSIVVYKGTTTAAPIALILTGGYNMPPYANLLIADSPQVLLVFTSQNTPKVDGVQGNGAYTGYRLDYQAIPPMCQGDVTIPIPADGVRRTIDVTGGGPVKLTPSAVPCRYFFDAGPGRVVFTNFLRYSELMLPPAVNYYFGQDTTARKGTPAAAANTVVTTQGVGQYLVVEVMRSFPLFLTFNYSSVASIPITNCPPTLITNLSVPLVAPSLFNGLVGNFPANTLCVTRLQIPAGPGMGLSISGMSFRAPPSPRDDVMRMYGVDANNLTYLISTSTIQQYYNSFYTESPVLIVEYQSGNSPTGGFSFSTITLFNVTAMRTCPTYANLNESVSGLHAMHCALGPYQTVVFNVSVSSFTAINPGFISAFLGVNDFLSIYDGSTTAAPLVLRASQSSGYFSSLSHLTTNGRHMLVVLQTGAPSGWMAPSMDVIFNGVNNTVPVFYCAPLTSSGASGSVNVPPNAPPLNATCGYRFSNASVAGWRVVWSSTTWNTFGIYQPRLYAGVDNTAPEWRFITYKSRYLEAIMTGPSVYYELAFGALPLTSIWFNATFEALSSAQLAAYDLTPCAPTVTYPILMGDVVSHSTNNIVSAGPANTACTWIYAGQQYAASVKITFTLFELTVNESWVNVFDDETGDLLLTLTGISPAGGVPPVYSYGSRLRVEFTTTSSLHLSPGASWTVEGVNYLDWCSGDQLLAMPSGSSSLTFGTTGLIDPSFTGFGPRNLRCRTTVVGASDSVFWIQSSDMQAIGPDDFMVIYDATGAALYNSSGSVVLGCAPGLGLDAMPATVGKMVIEYVSGAAHAHAVSIKVGTYTAAPPCQPLATVAFTQSTITFQTGSNYGLNRVCNFTVGAPPLMSGNVYLDVKGQLAAGDFIYVFAGAALLATYGDASARTSYNIDGFTAGVPCRDMVLPAAPITVLFVSNGASDPVWETPGMTIQFVAHAFPGNFVPVNYRPVNSVVCIASPIWLPGNLAPYTTCDYIDGSLDINVETPVSLPKLKGVTSLMINATQHTGLSIDLPNLQTIESLHLMVGKISTMNLPALKSAGRIEIGCVNLGLLSLPVVTTVGNLYLHDAVGLSTINAPLLTTVANGNLENLVSMTAVTVNPALTWGTLSMMSTPWPSSILTVVNYVELDTIVGPTNLTMLGVTVSVRADSSSLVSVEAPVAQVLSLSLRSMPALVSVTFPNVTVLNSIAFSADPLLASVVMPQAALMTGDVKLLSLPALQQVSMPMLGEANPGASFVLYNTGLPTLRMNSVTALSTVVLVNNTALTTFQMCKLQAPAFLWISGNKQLSCGDLNNELAPRGFALIIDGCDPLHNGTGSLCVPVCPDPGVPTDGTRTASMAPLVVGAQVWFTCSDGHRLLGAPALTCRSDLTWNFPTPACPEFKVVYPALTIDGIVPALAALEVAINVTVTGTNWNLPMRSVSGNGVALTHDMYTDAVPGDGLSASLMITIPPQSTAGYYVVGVEDGYGLTATDESSLYFTNDCPTEGTFGIGLDCSPCPTGGYCPGGNRVWPMPGYWNEGENSGYVKACPEPAGRCLGGRFSLCVTGYQGPLCAGCQTGYYGRGLECVQCPASSEEYTIYAVAAVFYFLLAVAFCVLKDAHIDSVVAIIKVLQLIRAGTAQSGARLPSIAKIISQYLSLVTFDFEFIKPACSFTQNYPGFSTLFWGNAIVIACLVVPTMVTLVILRFVRRQHAEFYTNRLFRAATIQVFLLYYVIATRTVQAVTCIQVGGSFRLAADTTVICKATSFVVMGGVGLALFTMSVPIAFAIVVHRLVRAGLTDNPTALARYGFLYTTIKIDGKRHLWVVVPFIQLLASAVAWGVLQSDGMAPYLLALVSFALVLLLSLIIRPFRRGHDNAVVTISYGLGCASVLLGFLTLSTVNLDVNTAWLISGATAAVSLIAGGGMIWWDIRSLVARENKIHPQQSGDAGADKTLNVSLSTTSLVARSSIVSQNGGFAPSKKYINLEGPEPLGESSLSPMPRAVSTTAMPRAGSNASLARSVSVGQARAASGGLARAASTVAPGGAPLAGGGVAAGAGAAAKKPVGLAGKEAASQQSFSEPGRRADPLRSPATVAKEESDDENSGL